MSTAATQSEALSRQNRRLRNLVEPIACCSIFSPEVDAEYVKLGLPKSELFHHGVHMPHFDTYVVTRSACLGHCHPEVVAAAFGVFRPDRITEPVRRWRDVVGPEAIQEARHTGALAALNRLIGEPSQAVQRASLLLRRATEALPLAGRPMFAGLSSLDFPGDGFGDLWHAANLFREHRGDSHISSWSARGLTGVESCIVNDLAQGLGVKSYVRTRGWSERELDTAVDQLTAKGYVRDGAFTEEGQALRESLEHDTDLQQRAAIEALGPDLDELCGLLGPWRDTIVDQGGYPGKQFVQTLRKWA